MVEGRIGDGQITDVVLEHMLQLSELLPNGAVPAATLMESVIGEYWDVDANDLRKAIFDLANMGLLNLNPTGIAKLILTLPDPD